MLTKNINFKNFKKFKKNKKVKNLKKSAFIFRNIKTKL